MNKNGTFKREPILLGGSGGGRSKVQIGEPTGLLAYVRIEAENPTDARQYLKFAGAPIYDFPFEFAPKIPVKGGLSLEFSNTEPVATPLTLVVTTVEL